MKNENFIDTLLYECQCAIFLVDILNNESFDLIKELLSVISDKYQFLSKILVLNKMDLESSRSVTDENIQNLKSKYNSLNIMNISIKTGDNMQQLLDEIYKDVNDKKSQFALNIVSTASTQKNNLSYSDDILTFILIGDSTVGKTAFTLRYFKNKFKDEFISTIGINKEIKAVQLGNVFVRIDLWDTAGQERFNSYLPKTYYQKADGVLLLFDVTNEDTFNNVKKWMGDVENNSPKKIKGENGNKPDIFLYLVGNKVDKPDRKISKEKAKEIAHSLGVKYFEISCKINLNIEEIMARMIIDCYMRANNVDNFMKLSPEKLKKDGKKKCCGGGEKKKDKK